MDYPNLRAEVLTGVVTGIKVSTDYPLTNLLGGGTVNIDGDLAKWDEFIPIREIDATFEGRTDIATPTDPMTVRPRAATMFTVFKKRYLYPEALDALRQVGAASADRDNALSNVTWMLGDMKRRFHDEPWEFMWAGLLQDNLSVTVKGVTVAVDYGLASGHDLTASTSWATASTDIDADVETVKRLCTQDSGRQLRYALCGRNVFGYLRKNTAVKTWFQNYVGADSRFSNFQGDRLENLFGLTWITFRHGYTVSSTWTPYIPDDKIVFIPEPAMDWVHRQMGSVRYPTSLYGAPTEFQKSYGLTSWSRLHDEPPSAQVFLRWAGFPVLSLPAAVVNLDTTT